MDAVQQLAVPCDQVLERLHVDTRYVWAGGAKSFEGGIVERRRDGRLWHDLTDEFGVKISDLQSKRRTNAIAYPRQIGMYLARKVTRHSLEEIGGFFGGRDHSTVLHAIGKVESLLGTEAETQDLVADLEARLKRSF